MTLNISRSCGSCRVHDVRREAAVEGLNGSQRRTALICIDLRCTGFDGHLCLSLDAIAKVGMGEESGLIDLNRDDLGKQSDRQETTKKVGVLKLTSRYLCRGTKTTDLEAQEDG